MPNPSPAEVVAGLRKSALTVYPSQLNNIPAFKDAPALGVLMETGSEKAVVTLLALIDGTASIYMSLGGGIIGGQGHETVRIAAHRFTQFAGIHLPEMTSCIDFPLPKAGQTTFYVLTSGGVFTHSAPEMELGTGIQSFSPLFHTGHYLISQLRKVTEKK